VEISFIANQMRSKSTQTQGKIFLFQSMKHTSELHKYDEFMCIMYEAMKKHYQGKEVKDTYKQTSIKKEETERLRGLGDYVTSFRQ
jgi:hypothetical protein